MIVNHIHPTTGTVLPVSDCTPKEHAAMARRANQRNREDAAAVDAAIERVRQRLHRPGYGRGKVHAAALGRTRGQG